MLTLVRYGGNSLSTFGLFFSGTQFLADSLELPYRDNTPYISCIPEGVYKIRWSTTNHEVGECYEVLDVPGRQGILIHPANSPSELKGCIAPGQKYGEMLWNSVISLRKLNLVIGEDAELSVTSFAGQGCV